jgi:1,4-alpha-glucan branching enzyme
MATKINLNGEISFTCSVNPKAKQVFLAGSFNDWNPTARRMQKGKDSAFRARLALPPGEHHYKFVIDGQWCADPDTAQQAPDPFGGVNSVVCVAPGAK